MAIIIGDIHGAIEKVKEFLGHMPEVEHIVLGDMVDSRKRGVTLEEELACLDLLFSSDAVLLWGNHDLAYTPERPWDSFTQIVLNSADMRHYAGTSVHLKRLYEENGTITIYDIFTERYKSQRDRIKAAYAAEGWLCTHAGVSTEKVGIIPAEIINRGTSQIATWLNEEFQREFQTPITVGDVSVGRYGIGPLFHVPRCRGGLSRFGGIFWYDPICETIDPSPLVGEVSAKAAKTVLYRTKPTVNPNTGKGLGNFPGFFVFLNCIGNLACQCISSLEI